ncbi:cupredoxin domain-containing protein [Jatrophihabitans sp. DSM 45814]
MPTAHDAAAMPLTAARPSPRRRLIRLSALCVAAFAISTAALAACSSSTDTTAKTGGSAASSPMSMPMSTVASGSTPSSMASSMAGAAQSAAMIHISSFKYTTPTSVSPGATVSVMNMDGENHTVTADSGNAFDAKADAGATVTFKAPMTPGSYPFHCTYHANMHGVLVVK